MNFDDMSKEDLINYIENINEYNNGKYGLIWDKEKEPEKIIEECNKYIPILKEIKEKELENGNEGLNNILIEGDNFHSLEVLNYTHKEAIDIIYIDPPYNTGKEFIYNDKIVNVEDGYRHSKWLNFMSKRLGLARNLLKDSGMIFISINEIEFAQLKLLCDSIFNPQNYVAIITWQNLDSVKNDAKYFSTNTEYILVYAKNKNELKIQGTKKGEKQRSYYKNYDDDPRGEYLLTPLHAKSGSETGKYTYVFKNGQTWNAPEGTYPRFAKTTLEKLENEGRIYLDPKGKKVPQKKTYLSEVGDRMPPTTFWSSKEYGSTRQSNSELAKLIGKGKFQNPKPTKLIKKLIDLVENKNAVILDFFAGSGTTGQAVMELNSEDNGNRKFILCTNNENDICEEITYKRIANYLKSLENPKHCLKYYKTDFIKNEGTRDQIYYDLTEKCIPMLCVKEDTYEVIKRNDQYAIYTNKERNKYTCVYFDTIGDKYEEFLTKVKEIKEKKILYIFTLGNKIDEPRLNEIKDYKIEAIPQRIYNLYKKLVRISKES